MTPSLNEENPVKSRTENNLQKNTEDLPREHGANSKENVLYTTSKKVNNVIYHHITRTFRSRGTGTDLLIVKKDETIDQQIYTLHDCKVFTLTLP